MIDGRNFTLALGGTLGEF
jgi:hypothetical protein